MATFRPLLGVILILALSLLVGCGDDDNPASTGGGETTTTGIGPEGGIVQIAGSVSLAIPQGALDDTVAFTIATNNSPAAMPGAIGPVSTCYTIEPSGTIFNSLATLRIRYNPALFGDAGEYTAKLYSDTGTGWILQTTIIDTANNTILGPVSHLSDFVVAADTTHASGEGFFAELVVGRTTYGGMGSFAMDVYAARLDSAYAPCFPIQPISGATITCEDTLLPWFAAGNQYQYAGFGMIVPGQTYNFSVSGTGIPTLVDSVVFPAANALVELTAPAADATLSPASDVSVTWSNSGSGTVDIIILSDAGDTVCFVQTANDGSHTIPHGTLTNPTGDCILMLSYYNRHNIDAAGYDSRSFIAGRVLNQISISFNNEG